MIIFLPCMNTCADALDKDSSNHTLTLLLFSMLVEARNVNNLAYKANFSLSFQKRVIDTILEVMNDEWSEKTPDDIEKEIEVIKKVHSALQLAGEHLGEDLDIMVSLFELANYLSDENVIHIVTNYPSEIRSEMKKWAAILPDPSMVDDSCIISPERAISICSRNNSCSR